MTIEAGRGILHAQVALFTYDAAVAGYLKIKVIADRHDLPEFLAVAVVHLMLKGIEVNVLEGNAADLLSAPHTGFLADGYHTRFFQYLYMQGGRGLRKAESRCNFTDVCRFFDQKLQYFQPYFRRKGFTNQRGLLQII